mmetsp:Transcript_50252/g.81132  ORF Transcript_50252/g.81132 Transcript_50252/m.81132 type:complete len:93 (-) Transcript_50252:51-329(-)
MWRMQEERVLQEHRNRKGTVPRILEYSKYCSGKSFAISLCVNLRVYLSITLTHSHAHTRIHTHAHIHFFKIYVYVHKFNHTHAENSHSECCQ